MTVWFIIVVVLDVIAFCESSFSVVVDSVLAIDSWQFIDLSRSGHFRETHCILSLDACY